MRAPSPAHSIDSTTMMNGHGTHEHNNSAAAAAPSSMEQPLPPRSKHIEVCVRLRPLHIQGDTSSASFFHPPRPPQSALPNQHQQHYGAHRKPGIPRPGNNPHTNPTSSSTTNSSHTMPTTATTTTKLASKLPSFMRSTKAGRRTTTTRPATDMDAPSTEPPPLFHNNNNNTSPLVVPPDLIYAWDVIDRDTVTQSPRTELVPGRTHAYTLDAVYGATVTTQQLYDASVRDLVRAALEGYHTAVLAYGQTSTGEYCDVCVCDDVILVLIVVVVVVV